MSQGLVMRRAVLMKAVKAAFRVIDGDEASYSDEDVDMLRHIVEFLRLRPDLSLSAKNPAALVSYDRNCTRIQLADYSLRNTSGRREVCKLGRFITRQAKLPLGGHVLAAFTESVMRNVISEMKIKFAKPEYKFTMFRGENVCTQYRLANSYSHSCMTGENSHLTTLYAANPKKVGLLVLKENGETIARALVWNVRRNLRVLDRVFPETHAKIFRRWAASQKVETVVRLTADYRAKGRLRMKNLIVPVPEVYPYLDTFCFTDTGMGGKTISLDNQDGDYRLDDTCGRMSGMQEHRTCHECGDRYLLEDMYYSHSFANYVCPECFMETHFTCISCGNAVLNESKTLVYSDGNENHVCVRCAETRYPTCTGCGKHTCKTECAIGVEGTFCRDCTPKFTCANCGVFPGKDEFPRNDEGLCMYCATGNARPSDDSLTGCDCPLCTARRAARTQITTNNAPYTFSSNGHSSVENIIMPTWTSTPDNEW